MAPDTNILSIVGNDGSAYYIDVIEGLQYAVEAKEQFPHRQSQYYSPTHNPLLAGTPSSGPGRRSSRYPCRCRQHWADHLHEVPGNNPYIITVGLYDTKMTRRCGEG